MPERVHLERIVRAGGYVEPARNQRGPADGVARADRVDAQLKAREMDVRLNDGGKMDAGMKKATMVLWRGRRADGRLKLAGPSGKLLNRASAHGPDGRATCEPNGTPADNQRCILSSGFSAGSNHQKLLNLIMSPNLSKLHQFSGFRSAV